MARLLLLLLYTTFVKRIIHKLTCSNALSIQYNDIGILYKSIHIYIHTCTQTHTHTPPHTYAYNYTYMHLYTHTQCYGKGMVSFTKVSFNGWTLWSWRKQICICCESDTSTVCSVEIEEVAVDIKRIVPISKEC